MKKTWIIVGSIILGILLLGGAWWYLLMHGRPAGLTIPNPFGDSSGGKFATTTPAVPRTVNTKLHKISATPVAGAVIFSRDGAEFVRYVERGTGHVFEIALANNTANTAATRITGTTIPRTTRAIWSPLGSRVVLVTETGADTVRLLAGTIERSDKGEGTLNTIELDPTARNVTFASSSESIYYTARTPTGSAGYAQNLKTIKASGRTVRFTSPLRDIVVTWEPKLVIYTTPTARLNGYAYEGKTFTRLFGGVRGLMLLPTPHYRVVSYAQNSSLVSHTDTLDGTALSIPVFPEKCVADPTKSTTLYCGAPLALASGDYPDSWYDGSVSFDDSIWQVDVVSGNATLISVPSTDVKEAIDVTDMHSNSAGDTLMFINKKDGALWVQEVPKT